MHGVLVLFPQTGTDVGFDGLDVRQVEGPEGVAATRSLEPERQFRFDGWVNAGKGERATLLGEAAFDADEPSSPGCSIRLRIETARSDLFRAGPTFWADHEDLVLK